MPLFEDNVILYTNSVVIGGVVIGKNVSVKAGSVIARNIEGDEVPKMLVNKCIDYANNGLLPIMKEQLSFVKPLIALTKSIVMAVENKTERYYERRGMIITVNYHIKEVIW